MSKIQLDGETVALILKHLLMGWERNLHVMNQMREDNAGLSDLLQRMQDVQRDSEAAKAGDRGCEKGVVGDDKAYDSILPGIRPR